MHRYLPDLAARQVPRYTSYPTAAEFHGGVGAPEQAAAIAAVPGDARVSLYVHIPFCHAICWYCGCTTGAVGRGDRIAPYLAALEREIDRVAASLRGRVIAVHFGGGSPNALAPARLAALVARLRAAFAIDAGAEWAIELDPRTIDARYAEALGRAGFARASLGVQTFALPIQHAINRIQPYRQVARVAAQLRGAGVRALNLDLMYGLPGQSLDDIAATVAAARTLDPSRVAMFGYAHLPRMLPRQRMIDEARLPGAEARFWQSALAHDLLVEAGCRAIGFDHFARPDDSLAHAARQGTLRRNFQGFTSDPATTVIGLGASAISRFDDVLVQNEKHVGRYRMLAENGRLAGVRGVAVSAEDRLRGSLIERLLCDGEVDVFRAALPHRGLLGSIFADLERLEPLVLRGLVRVRGYRVTLEPWARPYARLVAAAFDSYRSAPQERFSKAI